ncbi:MAG: CDP-alcohol phosphatidyltransferase family protein [Brachybacterium sp.]|nr:CDP-alcohol phosphatidyltransferase family protein [Brachybacterium sp.]
MFWRHPVLVPVLTVLGVIALVLTGQLEARGMYVAVLTGGAAFAVVEIGARRSRRDRLGPADYVTALRLALVAMVAGLGAQALFAGEQLGTVALVLTGVALVLDGVDGAVARATGSASAFGARFDMESDAFCLLVLSILAVPVVGWWVLAIGLMRYAWVAAGWFLPSLRGELPPSRLRRPIAAIQGVALLIILTEVVPGGGSVLVGAVALALLVLSFGRDAVRLVRAERSSASR